MDESNSNDFLKVIVCGAREFHNYEYLKEKLLELLPRIQFERWAGSTEIEVVNGDAIGADKLSSRFAREFNLNLKLFPVTDEDWKDTTGDIVWIKHREDGTPYNSAAGFRRNQRQVDYACPDGVMIAFLKGVSKGTKDSVRRAKKAGLEVWQINADKNEIKSFNR